MNPLTGVLAITALLAAFALVVWLACRPRKPKPLVMVDLIMRGDMTGQSFGFKKERP